MQDLISADAISKRLALVREQAPLIHNITNLVVMNNTANALLALGASPAMAHALDEVEDFVTISRALVINIGTLYPEQVAASKLAAAQARKNGIPWILDPVGAGATPYRRTAALALMQHAPQVIRGNASEILTLAQTAIGNQGKGVDSLHSSQMALHAAQSLARSSGAVVAVTGATDYVSDGQRVVEIDNGHALMTRVTGLGCSATAVVAAFLAVEADALAATVAALGVFALAGEMAAEWAAGPGSLQVALLDALYALDAATLEQRLRLRIREGS